MNVIVSFVFLVNHLNIIAAESGYRKINRNRDIKIVYDDRRSFSHPENVNDLPENNPLLPGHSLIRPAKTMLKSAVKYPQDDKYLFYGNSDNLGISYDKTNLRALYTGFRKDNQVVQLLKSLKQINEKANNNIIPLIVLQPNAKTKSKSAINNKLKEITLKAVNLLDNKGSILIKPKLKPKLKTSFIKNLKDALILIKPKSQDYVSNKLKEITMKVANYLHRQDPIELNIDPEASLSEKTHRIQNYLNSHIPVVKANSFKGYSSREIITKVNDFLNNQIPAGKSRLSLDEKTQYIEDFLNNRVPIFIKSDSYKEQQKNAPSFYERHKLTDEIENNANEILDRYSHEETEEEPELDPQHPDYRRKGKKSVKKYRKRDSKYASKTAGDSDVSASSDYEKNPGNPFTIHRNKYIQNWMWNHYMDGDHMNINPFAPPFASLGPTGADLFFGRKWWYFNQDDYKPMG